MNCEKCKQMMVLHAFSYGKCDVCDREITTPHVPCDTICERCSDDLGVCQRCSEPINLESPLKEGKVIKIKKHE